MKVLIVSYLYPPVGGGGVQRIKELSSFLEKKGCDVAVYTEEISLYKYDVYDYKAVLNSNVKLYGRKSIHSRNEEISKKTEFPKQHKNIIKKTVLKKVLLAILPDAYVSFLFRGLKWTFRTDVAYDVVIGSIKPASNGIIAFFYSILKRAHLVIEYRDLWFGQDFHDVEFSIFKRFYQSILLRKAKLIIVVSPNYLDKLIKQHPSLNIKDKCKVITNGYSDMYFNANNYLADRFKDMDLSAIIIAHFGRWYGPRVIDNIVLSLDEVNGAIKFWNFGPVINNSMICLDEYSFFCHNGYVSFEESWAIQQSDVVDILILIEYTIDNVPGKIFEYLASNKPIIVICDDASVLVSILKDEIGVHILNHENLKLLPSIILKIGKGVIYKRNITKYSRTFLYEQYYSMLNEL